MQHETIPNSMVIPVAAGNWILAWFPKSIDELSGRYCTCKQGDSGLSPIFAYYIPSRMVFVGYIVIYPWYFPWSPHDLLAHLRPQEVVLAAVRQCGLALRHAASELRRDWDVAMAAVRQNGAAPRFPQEIGLNEDLPTILINFNPCLMGFDGDHMESRSNDMILALSQNPS